MLRKYELERKYMKNRKKSIFSLRYFPVLLLLTYFGYHLYDYLQGYAVYKIDGACLRHKRGEVEWPHAGRIIQGPSPRFFVRAPIPYLGTGAPSDQGFTVYYWKRSLSGRAGRISDGGYLQETCARKDAAYGLVELTSQDQKKCFGSSFHQRFQPKIKTGPDATVIITCSDNPTVRFCKASDLMPNGWEANSAFSKEAFADWRVATAAARKFFNEKMEDCGAEQ